ncbi:MAG TPA: protein translocase subunit SecD, partial [Syntrophales bacterium]|nr:protein translocase subunit SecD [Syntrophales bacterium]
MASNIKWRSIFAVLIALAGLFYLLPSMTDHLPAFWKSYLPHDKIHLGLDLQGGMHLVLEVDTDKAVENSLNRTAGDLKD